MLSHSASPLSLSLSRTFSRAGRQDVQQQQQQQQQRRQITTTKCIVCKHVTSKNNNNVQQTTATTTRRCIVCWLILRSVNDAEISTLFSPSLPTPFSLSLPFLCLLLPFSLCCFPIFFCRPFLFYFIYLFYLPRRKSRPLSNNNSNNNNEQRQRQCRRDCGVKP